MIDKIQINHITKAALPKSECGVIEFSIFSETSPKYNDKPRKNKPTKNATLPIRRRYFDSKYVFLLL